MSKKVIAAIVAAFSFTACEDAVRPVTPVAVIAAPAARDGGTRAVEPTSQVVFAEPVFDAGPVDSLALTHDTPSVDHLARSRQLASDGDFKGGLTEARRALFSAPEDVETLTQVAKLARRARQPALAAEAWARVARMTPDDAQPVIQQGRTLLEAKDFAGAIIAGRDAVSRDEGNVEGYQIAGLGQLSLGELSGAIASFEKAVELAPQHGWALNNLGFAYLRANENAKALEVLERAAALIPNVAYVQNNLGVALERTGKADEAKAAYQHAMDLSPKYVKARINSARMAKAPVEPTEEPDTMSDIPVDAHPMP